MAAWAPVAYAGPSRALVRALKFDGALPAAALMAGQLAATLPEGLTAGATLVPVPADPARRRARGLDHADRLARALAARTGAPLERCLRRVAPGPPQARAGGRARRAPGRIVVAARGPVPALCALVDDVHTTGATLDACARALRAAGARRVVAVSYARTLLADGAGRGG